MSYSGSRDTPGSNLRCNCSASERVSTIVWNAAATLCERLSDALGIGFLARTFLTADLDLFFGATAMRLVFGIVPFLLEVFALFVAFEAVLLRGFLAIVDAQCRARLYSKSIGGAWAIAPEGSSPLWVKSRHGGLQSRCPLYPQKRTSALIIAPKEKPPDIARGFDVRTLSKLSGELIVHPPISEQPSRKPNSGPRGKSLAL
jgi:hypothetical protein